MESLIVILLCLVGWYWYDGNLARETAMKAARRACTRHDQQLLDETVVLDSIRPRRDLSGRVRWWRQYSFEFSGDGEQRRSGEISILGRRVTGLTLTLGEHTLYDQAEEERHG